MSRFCIFIGLFIGHIFGCTNFGNILLHRNKKINTLNFGYRGIYAKYKEIRL
jgi:hypothetical protein